MDNFKETDKDQYNFACFLKELTESPGKRKTIEINDRSLVLFLRYGKVFVLDSFCYHAGGPLIQGDIEDINGVTCVKCPWHKYLISIESGEGFYQSVDPKNLQKPTKWKSKGLKQRTHHCKIMDSKIYIALNKDPTKIESDYYYSEEYKSRMAVTRK